jgi:hypothetical protein
MFESRQGKEFSLLLIIQTSPRAYPAIYPKGTGGSFRGRGEKGPGREANTLSPAIAEVNNTWIYKSTPPYVFVA